MRGLRVGLILALLLSPIAAISAENKPVKEKPVQIGDPVYSGSGCPNGTLATSLSPDNSALSLLFSDFTVDAGGSAKVRSSSKKCVVRVPITIPKNESMMVLISDYRGFNNLPENGKSTLDLTYELDPGHRFDHQKSRFTKVFRGPSTDNFAIRARWKSAWSPCGGKMNLTLTSKLNLETNKSLEEASSTIDTIDFTGTYVPHRTGWFVRFFLKKCK